MPGKHVVPGGRVAVSDLALLKPLPAAILEMVEALIGCVAGAVLVAETERMAKEAGLTEIVLNKKSGYIDGMVDWQDPLYQKIIAHLPAGTKPGEYITSRPIPRNLNDWEPRLSDVCPRVPSGQRVDSQHLANAPLAPSLAPFVLSIPKSSGRVISST